MRFFDNTWDEMNASYMDFQRVIKSIESELLDNLNSCSSLEQLNQKSLQKKGGKKEKKKLAPSRSKHSGTQAVMSPQTQPKISNESTSNSIFSKLLTFVFLFRYS